MSDRNQRKVTYTDWDEGDYFDCEACDAVHPDMCPEHKQWFQGENKAPKIEAGPSNVKKKKRSKKQENTDDSKEQTSSQEVHTGSMSQLTSVRQSIIETDDPDELLERASELVDTAERMIRNSISNLQEETDELPDDFDADVIGAVEGTDELVEESEGNLEFYDSITHTKK